MKIFKAFIALSLLALAVFWPGEIDGQTSSLQTSVALKQLYQPNSPSSTVFSIVSTGADTAHILTPASYTSLLTVAHGDSVDVKVRFFCGYKDAGVLHVELKDSTTISTAGADIYQLNIPASRSLFVTFTGGSSNGATTTIDSTYLMTQW